LTILSTHLPKLCDKSLVWLLLCRPLPNSATAPKKNQKKITIGVHAVVVAVTIGKGNVLQKMRY
jgi:hypothetical protein